MAKPGDLGWRVERMSDGHVLAWIGDWEAALRLARHGFACSCRVCPCEPREWRKRWREFT